MKIPLLTLFISLFVISCGSVTDVPFSEDIVSMAPPTINRVDPASPIRGDKVVIYGFGFSIVPENNFVSFGNNVAVGEKYEIPANPTAIELEAITFTVPENATTGVQNIVVTTGENTSNANVVITIN